MDQRISPWGRTLADHTSSLSEPVLTEASFALVPSLLGGLHWSFLPYLSCQGLRKIQQVQSSLEPSTLGKGADPKWINHLAPRYCNPWGVLYCHRWVSSLARLDHFDMVNRNFPWGTLSSSVGYQPWVQQNHWLVPCIWIVPGPRSITLSFPFLPFPH